MDTPPKRDYRVLAPTDVVDVPKAEFGNAVLEGLSERPKRLPSRFIYDDTGSELFQRIMDLPEYYPTRCESEILESNAARILDRFAGRRLNLIDLGAGDGKKTMLLLRYLAKAGMDVCYVPIDISEGAMIEVTKIVRAELPDLQIEGVVAEYTTALRWIAAHSQEQSNLVLFLGSNLGNFNRASSRVFLRRMWSALNPSDCMMIGFDLKKDIDLLLSAYNDPTGVTASFNKNLLARINRELGGNFDLDKFRHYATYDVFSGAVESYLVSLEPQRVRVDHVQQTFTFDAWEPIHTEYSYKFLESDIDRLAEHTGFFPEDAWFDSERWFVDSLWRVQK